MNTYITNKIITLLNFFIFFAPQSFFKIQKGAIQSILIF
jgi:hypothetical protein